MWWQAKVLQTKAARAAHQALAKIVVATVLIIIGLIGNAEACPESKTGAQPVFANHKIERVLPAAAEVVSVSPTQIVAKLNRQYNGQCCGAGCHAHSVACASACCGAGSASINPIISNLLLPTKSIRLLLFDQAEAISARPAPDFRPPRSFS
jgi:hypothetical protein